MSTPDYELPSPEGDVQDPLRRGPVHGSDGRTSARREGSTVTAAEHHRDILQRLEALAAAHPEVNGSAMEFLIQDQRRKLAAAEATEAITAAPTGETTLGYQKSATGAMEPRTVDVRRGEYIAPAGDYRTYNPVGNVQKPDIRIDPPYDR